MLIQHKVERSVWTPTSDSQLRTVLHDASRHDDRLDKVMSSSGHLAIMRRHAVLPMGRSRPEMRSFAAVDEAPE